MSRLTCGALSKGTRQPCQNVAGKGTDHFGEGRCRLHGGATPTKHGLYSKVRRTRLGQRMAEIADDPNLFTLRSELTMLKALNEQAARDYEKHEAALQAWHRSESPCYKKLIDSSDASEIRDSIVELRSLESKRPRACPDAKIVATLVREIGRIQDRIRDAERVLTRGQLQQMLDRMAGVVCQFTNEETTRKIRDSWLNLTTEGR
jgi:hypothetical protein